MDPFELLIRASDPDVHDKEVHDAISSLEKRKMEFNRSFMGPIDSIMMLAEQASKISPLDGSQNISSSNFGPYFNSPKNVKFRRARAMSEPWLPGDLNIDVSSASAAKRRLATLHAVAQLGLNCDDGTALSECHEEGEDSDGREDDGDDDDEEEDEDEEEEDEEDSGATQGGSASYGWGGCGGDGRGDGGGRRQDRRRRKGGRVRASSVGSFDGQSHFHSPSLPQMMEQYSSIYNVNGRIGIYTKQERAAIINRFRQKRQRRVWKKKIRYSCRKNLADRRVRVKGRFVKAGSKLHTEMMQQQQQEEQLLMPIDDLTKGGRDREGGGDVGNGGGVTGTSAGSSEGSNSASPSDVTTSECRDREDSLMDDQFLHANQSSQQAPHAATAMILIPASAVAAAAQSRSANGGAAVHRRPSNSSVMTDGTDTARDTETDIIGTDLIGTATTAAAAATADAGKEEMVAAAALLEAALGGGHGAGTVAASTEPGEMESEGGARMEEEEEEERGQDLDQGQGQGAGQVKTVVDKGGVRLDSTGLYFRLPASRKIRRHSIAY